jgi:hypothetical protein
MVRAVGGAKIHANWTASAGRLVYTRDNASVGIEWGEDGSGIDNTWYGDTSGAYMQWDESANALNFVNCAVNIASASFAGNIALGDGKNISIGTGSGSQIATGSTQKLGFFGASPIIQPSAPTAATCSATPSVAIATIKDQLIALGILHT